METLEMKSIRQLFEDKNKYIVPIYQRDYAWTHKEAKQLIDDIRDYIRGNKDKSYFIGSLVVYGKGDNLYEVIDGQQRFTTLTIMLRALNELEVNVGSELTELKLSFEHRAKSTESLQKLGVGSTSIDEMYHYLSKADYGDKNEFVGYLLNNVKILLVEVPQGTDLNHYFEIMNTRGEQLEKQEVLKARLMNMLKYDESKRKTAHSLFNIIWEACADMDSYAMMNIKADVRNVLYGDKESNNNIPQIKDFDSMVDAIIESGKQTEAIKKATEEDAGCNEVKIGDVVNEFLDGSNRNLEGYEIPRNANNEEKPERFKSIIDFPNFLLQVLSVYLANNPIKDNNDENVKATLDDKQLLQTFEKVEKYLDTEEKKMSFAKDYIVYLLRVRSLFDIYVLKSDTKNENDGKWKIQQYNRNGNRYDDTFSSTSAELEMIESMFHFSHTSNTYNNWLNAALKYAVNNEKDGKLESGQFYEWLEKLAKLFMLRNYMANKSVTFENIINDCLAEKSYDINCNFSCLDRGCDVDNFIFNFYDYVVWKNDAKSENKKYGDFSFTYRTSVEHFYPQHPGEDKKLEGNHQEIVDRFGNLCLITSSMNSRFNNLMPKAKYEQYGAGNVENGKQSIKLMQLFERMRGKEDSDWNKDSIEEFTQKCKCTLIVALGLMQDNTCSDSDKYILVEQ